MIIIRVFMKPKGIGPERLMSEALIHNDCTGTESKGNYRVTLTNVSHGNTERRRFGWKVGNVKNFPRLRLGVWDLLFRALQATVGSRNGESQPAVS